MRPVTIKGIDDVINFGKHKGKPLTQIALIDPDYIEWLCRHVGSFIITNEIIDELSEYCLSIFFKDPVAFLSDSSHQTTLVSDQHLKYGGKEIILGDLHINQKTGANIITLPHSITSQVFLRKVFRGDACKKALKERIDDEGDMNKEFGDVDDSIDIEDIRISHNDAYEVDSNDFDGWYEPID